MATLGTALAWAGQVDESIATLNGAVAAARGELAGRVLMRRASVLRSLGQYSEALDDLNRALPIFRRVGDRVWEARSLTHRAEIYLSTNDFSRAVADYRSADRLHATSGQVLEYAMSQHNLGRVALALGDIPTAFRNFDQADLQYRRLDAENPDLAMDRCAAFLLAGLPAEAVRAADDGASLLRRRGGDAMRAAELDYAAADAALYAGDPDAARHTSRHGPAARSRGRDVICGRRGPNCRCCAPSPMSVAHRCAYWPGPKRSPIAWKPRTTTTPCARTWSRAGSRAPPATPDRAVEHFNRVARARRSGSALRRSVGWLGQALAAETVGNGRGVTSACGRGLDVLDEHRLTLGATELRASTTAHGAELAQIAQRQAVATGDARRLLLWSERWRATTLGLARASTAPDDELVADLSALRAVNWQLDAARADSGGTRATGTALDHERNRLEQAVRTRSMRSGSVATAASRPARPG